MKASVLEIGDGTAWCAALDRCSERDVYFLPEFHRAYEAHGYGKALAFVAEADGDVLFHPFFIRRIDGVAGEPLSEELYDLESVNGYTGPLASTTDPAFLGSAWEAFGTWCREQRVIAEFVRFNPLLDNGRYADPAADVYADRDVVVVDLTGGEEAIWERYPSVQRNMVRRAWRDGLVAEQAPLDDGLPVFRRLYDATMDRLDASWQLRFGDAYFRELRAGIEEQLRLYVVRRGDGGGIVAAAMFIADGERLHYHLAGSDPAERSAPNNLILHTAAVAGSEAGQRRLHLGGGRSPDPKDPLFRFKASISRDRLPYLLGRRVHDPEAYEALCARWVEATGAAERPRYFFLYRLDAA